MGAVLCRSRSGLRTRFRFVVPSHPPIPELQHLATPLAEGSGLAVVGVQLHTQRMPLTLVVQLRRADGGDVSLDECAAFSTRLGEELEGSALLPESYVLEVSSPGIGEELSDDRDFRSFRGFPVEVCLRDSKGGESRREGLLLERDGRTVQLNIRGRISRIPRDEVIAVRLITPTE